MSAEVEQIRLRQIRTPEGFSLPFPLAAARDRALAFAVDFLVMFGATLVLWLVALLIAALGLPAFGISLAIAASFFLWNFYFVWCEARFGGTTIGKRAFKLRVVAREGGPLRFEAVFARNVMRNLEFFLPLMVLTAPEQLFPAVPAWGSWIVVLWIFVFALFPLFNRDRLRCGDLVGGTIVIRQPVSLLLADLAAAAGSVPAPGRPREQEVFPFTRGQLSIYGVKELQVLEDLLRKSRQGALDPQVLYEVSTKIRIKIGWTLGLAPADTGPFLEAFYRAQRAHLEQRMLFGQRRESKSG